MLKTIKHGINLLKHATRTLHEAAPRSSGWPKVEKDFLSKNPTCAACGSTTRLNVHHKHPFHLHPELELDENNLITLCMDKDCHLLIGHGDDFKAYNPNIEADVQAVREGKEQLANAAVLAKRNRLYE